MYQILEVANCYLFLIFAQVLWTRIVRSKPIIKTLLMFQFHIQRLKTSGPIPELKKNLVSDWENVIAYWEVRHQQTNLVHSKNSWGFRVVAAVQPQKKLGICENLGSVSRTQTTSKLLHNEYCFPYPSHIRVLCS